MTLLKTKQKHNHEVNGSGKAKKEEDTKDQGSFLQQVLIKYNQSGGWVKISSYEQTVINMAKSNRFESISKVLAFNGIASNYDYIVAQELSSKYYKSVTLRKCDLLCFLYKLLT